jgi:isoquinoline 1-oxidoreductase beta subunit
MTTRRAFLIGGATAAGGLMVGYILWPSTRLVRLDRAAAKRGERFVGGWVKIADDDVITVVIPHCDMGTGIYTSLAQMAADELDADWSKVRTEVAPADRLFANGALVEGFLLDGRHEAGNPVPAFLQGAAASATRTIAELVDLQTTGGSSAVRMTGVFGMRATGAAAREMLVRAAAQRMQTGTDAFRTDQGRVIHAPSGRTFRYGELADAAAAYAPSSHPRLKAREAFTLIGKPIRRLDIPAKVNGATQYGLDVTLPRMQYGAIKISPVFGGTLVSMDDTLATKRRGVTKVVRLEDAVVVVADRFWRARAAVDALEPDFDGHGNERVSSQTIHDRHVAVLQHGPIKKDHSTGAGAAALGSGAVVERLYSVPYLAHATMEPMNATALFNEDGTLEVWAGTQDGLGARAFCAKAARIGIDKVSFHLLPSGGAFGRRLPGHFNFLSYAVKTAMAVPGVPVKLIFTREQDIQHDFYRPNVSSRFRATLGSDGLPLAWVNDYTTDDRANPEAHIIYDVPNQAYGAAKVVTHVPVGPWRSVESSWHGFFVESFVDELAHQSHRDPLEYRRALLKDRPRHLATLDLATEQAGWGTPLPSGQGRGVAIVECFGTIVAHVATVEVTNAGTIKVHRITSAVDCGMAVNPDGFTAQIEGAIIFGLSAALWGEITIEHGAAAQRNFPDYPVVHLADCPAIDVHIRESDGPLGGAGEPGTPPVAPAVTNAIFAATGVRIRDLPISKHSLLGAGPQV